MLRTVWADSTHLQLPSGPSERGAKIGPLIFHSSREGYFHLWQVDAMDPPRPRQRIRALARMSVFTVTRLPIHLRASITASAFEEMVLLNMTRGSDRQVGTPTEVCDMLWPLQITLSAAAIAMTRPRGNCLDSLLRPPCYQDHKHIPTSSQCYVLRPPKIKPNCVVP
ncbi:uncharacterized protein ARMOST_02531 [Armillaria ostoyae]|uniref:Uncharacterized protein n=1 Tax=Armillaria ostoyae TaxID=47428 RepID=A0A284QRY7_ARMOS|nr:uncharacterized protein ARMOST_02531 [Armillaria ostoyae]